EIDTMTVTSASIPCAFSVGGYSGFSWRLRFGGVYFTPATGMRVATWFLLPLPVGAGGPAGGGGAVSLGGAARSGAWPTLVSPTANAGPPPPSAVESRLIPTTRGGGPLGAAGGGAATFFGGGGGAFFTIGSGLGGSG